MGVRRLPAAVAVACVLALSGCSDAAPDPRDAALSWSQFRSMVDESLAKGGDLSPAQAEILERAKALDEMTFALVEEAVNNAFTCMEGVGVTGTWMEPDTEEGFPVPTYKYGTSLDRPQSEWLPVAEECIRRESSVAEALFQLQPKAESLRSEYFREVRRPAIVACLEENGVEVPDDATEGEIDALTQELYHESQGIVWIDNGDGSLSGHASTPENAVHCYLDTLP